MGVVPVQHDPFESRSVAVARHFERSSGVDQEVSEYDGVLFRQRVTNDTVEPPRSPSHITYQPPFRTRDRDIIYPRASQVVTHNIPPLLLNNLLTSTLAANSLLRHPSAGTQ